jgi:VWFA-related protein
MFFLWLILSLVTSAPLYAQDKKNEDDEVLRIDTQLVDVPIVVTDKNGKPLLNLKQSNFIVYEDGKTQEISNFSTTSAPFEVALLLDTSGSARGDLELIQRAATHFIVLLHRVENFGQAVVEMFQSFSVTFRVAAMPVEHIEINQI